MAHDADPFMITTAEVEVLNALTEAWNLFVSLPIEHADDLTDFRGIIHRGQDMVLGRAGRRQVNAPKVT